MNGVGKMVSLREIRKLVKRKCDYEVSQESLILMRDCCEQLIDEYILRVVEEIDEINSIRSRAGIPILKRIKKTCINTFCQNLLKTISVFYNGNDGNASAKVTTLLSQAGEVT